MTRVSQCINIEAFKICCFVIYAVVCKLFELLLQIKENHILGLAAHLNMEMLGFFEVRDVEIVVEHIVPLFFLFFTIKTLIFVFIVYYCVTVKVHKIKRTLHVCEKIWILCNIKSISSRNRVISSKYCRFHIFFNKKMKF